MSDGVNFMLVEWFREKTVVVAAVEKGWRGGWPRRSACRRVSVVSTGCTSSVAAAPPAHPAHRSTQNSRLPIACRPPTEASVGRVLRRRRRTAKANMPLPGTALRTVQVRLQVSTRRTGNGRARECATQRCVVGWCRRSVSRRGKGG